MYEGKFNIGCQTFTWEMLGKDWTGSPDDLIAAISAAGYTGIEITDTMIGHYKNAPQEFAVTLKNHGLTLVAFGFGSDSGFTTSSRLQSDLDTAQRWIDFAGHFPDAIVSIGSATAVSDDPREKLFDVATEYYNKAAAAGHAAGVSVAIHPSSHHNTLLLTREDYDRLFVMLDKDRVGWVPDTGHIIRGQHDLLDTMRCYQDRIRYVHLKDVDEQDNWAMLGQGVCDIPAVLDIVRDAPAFNGWVVAEEESVHAGLNPDAAVRENYEVLKSMGF